MDYSYVLRRSDGAYWSVGKANWIFARKMRMRRGNSRGNRELKIELCEAQNWRCCYCPSCVSLWDDGAKLATFEHVVPLSKGGASDKTNLVIACRDCNNVRGNKDVQL